MRRLIAPLLVVALLAVAPADAHAQCEACGKRAAQFWGAVVKEMNGTSPALADYLARNEIAHGRAEAPVYFLTPDCGLHPDQLEETLDIAKAANVRMTIFLMGRMIDRWPDQSAALLKRVVAEGHELALHSYTHRNFRDLSNDEIADEMVRTWALIDWALGYHYPIRFFRFPYGARNPDLMQAIGAMGIQSVFWDIDSLGWRDYASVPIVVQQVTTKARQGAVVVLHCSSIHDRGALPYYVEELRKQGLEPALLGAHYARPTASDLVGYPKPRPAPTATPVPPETPAADAVPAGDATATPSPEAPRETPGQRRLSRMLDMEQF